MYPVLFCVVDGESKGWQVTDWKRGSYDREKGIFINMIRRVSSYILFFGVLVLLGCTSVFALPPEDGNQRQGFDVSMWQGDIDFEEVAGTGADTVYIRSSLGSDYTDPYFEQNYERARAAGLNVGFYHYVTARTVSQAVYEAHFFVNVIQGKEFQCRLAMDFEDLTSLSAGEANEIGLAFIRTVESLSGKGAVVYSDAYNAGNVFGGALTEYPLWIADYDVSEPSSQVNWESWAGWQYSDTGNVAGISGYVDLDRYTDAMFLDEAGSVPEPAPMPEPSWSTVEYTVKSGDTLWGIARMYRTSVSAVVSENGIANPNLIYPGEVLRITLADQVSSSQVDNTYTVRRGDTLWGIARMYRISVARLAAINHISDPNLIYPGEVLQVSASGSTGDMGRIYIVRYGDTLSGIAVRFGTTVSQLAAVNGIADPNLIYAGEVLTVN